MHILFFDSLLFFLKLSDQMFEVFDGLDGLPGRIFRWIFPFSEIEDFARVDLAIKNFLDLQKAHLIISSLLNNRF